MALQEQKPTQGQQNQRIVDTPAPTTIIVHEHQRRAVAREPDETAAVSAQKAAFKDGPTGNDPTHRAGTRKFDHAAATAPRRPKGSQRNTRHGIEHPYPRAIKIGFQRQWPTGNHQLNPAAVIPVRENRGNAAVIRDEHDPAQPTVDDIQGHLMQKSRL
ncbi:hypothetical protein [Frankia sp. Cr1]|uniref:hypothetical protein n=1 Tax=Frankia sp. Cr1 TaxID=3073931 RepID=UPI002AD5AB06|nr:hypothetical protein [Frankia sp. Cr1]